MIRRLEEIRIRTVRHSSVASVTSLAAEIPLPEGSVLEPMDLGAGNPAEIRSLMQATSPPELGWEPQPDLGGLPCDEENELGQDVFAIEGSWFETLNLGPNAEGTFVLLNSIHTDEEGHTSHKSAPTTFPGVSDCNQRRQLDHLAETDKGQASSAETVSLDRGTAPTCLNSSEPSTFLVSAGQGTFPISTTSEGVPKDRHFLLRPWAETLPGMLEAYLDSLEWTSPSCRRLLGDEGTPKDSEQPSASADESNQPVSTEQLLTLQDGIAKAYRYHASLKAGISQAYSALRCNPLRWERGRCRGTITRLMKGLGSRSPLSEMITADERWPADDWSDLKGVDQFIPLTSESQW